MLRGRGGTAHLQRDSVALDRAGIRLVIPLEAIQSVHVTRGKRPTAEIRLNSTATKARPTMLCTISSRDTEKTKAFARAVNAALPQRDKAERHVDGAALVKAEKRFIGPWTPRALLPSKEASWASSVLACLFVLGLLPPVQAGDGRLTQLWIGGFVGTLMGCYVAHGTWRATVTWWLLHRYGVTTEARCASYYPGSDVNTPGTMVFSFTDTSGTDHTFERTGWTTGLDKRIAYDPARPDFARGPAHPWARILLLLLRLLLGVPVMLAMAAFLVWYFTTAMHA
ncbi:hypothetical protein [Streptomyces sp. TLI_185]|uniref:hypothetical protein n=1 Tax=Streptomyces sp. TLI_185 TaxID=2485151 RepID=UPI0011CF6BBA|nr:hypothetical protein [Streptomyces sp. TLI_185]